MNVSRRALVASAGIAAAVLSGCSEPNQKVGKSEKKQATKTVGWQSIEVLSVSFFQNPENGVVGYAVKLHNPNSSYMTNLVPISITFRDVDGKLVGSTQEFCSHLYPGGTTFICNEWHQVSGVVDTMEASVGGTKDDYRKTDTPQTEVDEMVYVSDLEESTGYEGAHIATGTVVNDSHLVLDVVSASIVYFDSSGNPVGGERAQLDGAVSQGGFGTFTTNANLGAGPVHSEIKAFVNILTLSE